MAKNRRKSYEDVMLGETSDRTRRCRYCGREFYTTESS